MNRRRAERRGPAPTGVHDCPVCKKPGVAKNRITCSRKCALTHTTSPYQQRGKARAWLDDANVEPALVVRAEDLAKLDAMCAARPLKPPPTRFAERNDAARVAARKDRNGVA